MPLAKKNIVKKRKASISKEPNSETIIVTKKTITINDVVLPEKFKNLNDMLAKTRFIS